MEIRFYVYSVFYKERESAMNSIIDSIQLTGVKRLLVLCMLHATIMGMEHIEALLSVVKDARVYTEWAFEKFGDTEDRKYDLHEACKEGREICVRYILSRNNAEKLDTLNEDKLTPLHIACDNGNITIIELLLRHGSPIDASGRHGWRPIHVACMRGHVKAVEILVKQSASLLLRDSDGWSPLQWACMKGHTNLVKFLVNYMKVPFDEQIAGILHPPHERIQREITPLLIASMLGYVHLVEFLIKEGASLDWKGPAGLTPLYVASERGHIEVVRLLLQKGAKKTIASDAGKLPVDCVSDLHRDELILLLTK